MDLTLLNGSFQLFLLFSTFSRSIGVLEKHLNEIRNVTIVLTKFRSNVFGRNIGYLVLILHVNPSHLNHIGSATIHLNDPRNYTFVTNTFCFVIFKLNLLSNPKGAMGSLTITVFFFFINC